MDGPDVSPSVANGRRADQRFPFELHVEEWLNTADPTMAPECRGKVVMIEAFQLLCPGCVSHALPQAQRVHALFADSDLVVIGLHTVFEHHQAQGRTEVLEAFVHEYRLTFPIGIDTPSSHDPIPQTMRAYGMRGTPSLLLFDRDGKLVLHKFGAVDDLALGATIATQLVRPAPTEATTSTRQPGSAPCDDQGCPIP